MSAQHQGVRTCYRHPDSPAGVVCQRCGRPICPRCMNQASVGFHCPECLAKEHTRVVRPGALRASQPILTIVLMGVNIVVWIAGQLLWKTNDLLTTAPEVVTKGGLFSDLPTRVAYVGNTVVGYTDYVGVAEGEWYRLLTAGFIHAGLIHLAMNMWMLYVLGRITEEQLGRSRLGLIYFASLFAGSFGALLHAPNSVTVGASGAIFGLMGGIMAVAKARGVALRHTGLLGVVVINLVITFGLSNYISVGAHVGGLIGGAIAGLVVIDLPDRLRGASTRTRNLVSWAGGIALCAVFIAAGILVANSAQGRNGPVAAGRPAPLQRVIGTHAVTVSSHTEADSDLGVRASTWRATDPGSTAGTSSVGAPAISPDGGPN